MEEQSARQGVTSPSYAFLRECLKEAGWSLKDMKAALGYTDAVTSNWRSRGVPPKEAIRIAPKLVDVSPEELVAGKRKTRKKKAPAPDTSDTGEWIAGHWNQLESAVQTSIFTLLNAALKGLAERRRRKRSYSGPNKRRS